MPKRRHPTDLAREALEQLQAFVSGRVPAWELPYSKMKAYKADLRPVGKIQVAELQDRLAGCKMWVEYLPTSEQRMAAESLISCCRRRNARALNYLFAVRDAKLKAELESGMDPA